MPDDTLEIPVTGTGDDSMADTTVATVLDQAFADNHTARMHAGRRLTETNDNVSEQTKLGYLEEGKKVGTREAAAMQRMDTSKIAQEILQARATKDQPQASPP